MITRGTYWSPLRSLRKKRFAAFLFRRLCDAYVEHISILIHRSPQIVGFAVDFEKYLVHMPFVATTRTPPPQFIGVRLAKFKTPFPDRFIAHNDPALRQKLFDITKTEREPK